MGYAQQKDKFRVYGGFSYSILPIKSNLYKKIDNSINEKVSKTVIGFKSTGFFALNLPFYRTKHWSTGIKANLGVGYQVTSDEDDLTSPFLNFPQFVYWRSYKKFDFSILAGYQYTYCYLPYHLFLVGFDVNLKDVTLRAYGSPFSNNYYYKLTNGTYQYALRMYEFGLLIETPIWDRAKW